MAKYTRFVCASLAATFTLAACNKEQTQDTLARDTTLTSDLQLANKDTTSPALTDVPATNPPAPSAAKPAPRPAPRPTPRPAPKPATTPTGNAVVSGGTKERALGTIPAGSSLSLASNSRVCTNNHKVGDRVTATVSNTVSGSNGAVIPAGATASLEITELKRSENANDKIAMGFAVRSVSFGGKTYPVSGTTTSAAVERVRNQPSGKDAQKVATGAAVGAVLGQVLGKNTKSTVIGGAVGAAAGAGAAAATANYEGCVADGGNITVALSNPVQVHI